MEEQNEEPEMGGGLMINKPCVYATLSVLMLGLAPFRQLAFEAPGDQPEEKDAKQAIEWGPEKNGVRCAVALADKKQKIHADEPVNVLLLTKNVSAEDVRIINEGHLLNVYSIPVLGPDGKPTPLTAYGREQVENARRGSESTGTLAPGKERGGKGFLSRMYDMSRT